MKRQWITFSIAGAALAAVGVLLGKARRAGPRNASATVPYGHGTRLEEIKTIAREPMDVYAAWRDLESLPLVMPHVKRVEELGASGSAGASAGNNGSSGNGKSRSRWTVVGPNGTEVAWEAEIFEDVPGERIAWRADDAPVRHAGTVRFSPAPGGRGTEVRVEIEYAAPGGPLSSFPLKVIKKPPLRLLELDLRRFKSVLEAGDVAVNGTDVLE